MRFVLIGTILGGGLGAVQLLESALFDEFIPFQDIYNNILSVERKRGVKNG